MGKTVYCARTGKEHAPHHRYFAMHADLYRYRSILAICIATRVESADSHIILG